MASVNKPTYFNIEGDKELLEFANSLPSFSTWVKEKIREELSKHKSLEIQENQKLAEIIDQPKGEGKKNTLTWKL